MSLRTIPRLDLLAIPLLAAAAAVLGVALARWPLVGAGLAAGAVYVLIAVRSPALAVALWIPSFFLSFLPGGNQLLQAGFPVAALAVAVAWSRHSRSLPLHRGVSAAVVVLAAWIALSVVWARNPGAAVSELWKAGLAIFVALAVVAVCREERHALWLAAAFAGGAVLSALIGLVGGDAVAAYAGGILVSDRLAGGAGDANQLAAGLVPSVALLIGLVLAAPRRGARAAAAVGIPIALVAIAASQSRGGAFSFGVMIVALVILVPRARTTTLAVVGAGAVVLTMYFIANPAALERISSVEDEGSGRSDLWRVGWRMTLDHPFGVGLDNFRQVSHDYVLTDGLIERVRYFVDTPIVAHNTFLQVLSESGFPGLALYLTVLALSLACARRAATTFAQRGNERLALLARVSMVALVSFLASSFFVSFAFSYRMWALIALGPALLTVALRTAAPAASEGHVAATR